MFLLASSSLIIDDISIYEEKPIENTEMNSIKEEGFPQLFSDEEKIFYFVKYI